MSLNSWRNQLVVLTVCGLMCPAQVEREELWIWRQVLAMPHRFDDYFGLLGRTAAVVGHTQSHIKSGYTERVSSVRVELHVSRRDLKVSAIRRVERNCQLRFEVPSPQRIG